MAISKPFDKLIVIDTEHYAGNFEREMCAYITGRVGECGVGEELAAAEEANIKNLDWFDANVTSVADEHGCYRPCTMWLTAPGGQYNSVAIFVDEFPPKEALEEIEERAKYFCDNYSTLSRFSGRKNLTYLGMRFFEPEYKLTEVKL